MSADRPDQERRDRDSDVLDDEPLFESADGLYTEQDLRSLFGTSPVTIDVGERNVLLKIGLGGGHVAANVKPDQAREMAKALEDAADELDRPE